MLNIRKEGILLGPTDNLFENKGVFNPAVILVDGMIHLFYRATNRENYSTIGYCALKTPYELSHRMNAPVLVPIEKYEAQGIEDPRIVKIDQTFYMSYTAYDGKNAVGALMLSKDLKSFLRMGILTPQMTYGDFELCAACDDALSIKYKRFAKLYHKRTGPDAFLNMMLWDKDVSFFPRKINGSYAFLHRIYPDIQVTFFSDIAELSYPFWKDYLTHLSDNIVLKGKYDFESSYIGGGCPPIETMEGWLIIYHGVRDSIHGYIYSAGAALMDIDDPTQEIGRLPYPLFEPTLEWEMEGVTDHVVFPTGAIVFNDELHIYYGAADKYIGVATVSLQSLLTEIKSSTYVNNEYLSTM